MASVPSFNHGWRNYRFIFSIIFIFTTSPFCITSLASPSLRCIAPLLSPSIQSSRTRCTATSLIFSSPFLALLFFFRSFLISFHFILPARCLSFLFNAASLFLLPSSVCLLVIFFTSLGSRSFFLGLPASM